MVFAYKSSVLNRFFSQLLYIRFRTNNTDIVRVSGVLLPSERDMLSYQHPNANTRHVEAVEEGLNRGVDLHTLPFALVFVDARSNGGNDAVVPSFDRLKCLSELAIVVCQLLRPLVILIDRRKIAP